MRVLPLKKLGLDDGDASAVVGRSEPEKVPQHKMNTAIVSGERQVHDQTNFGDLRTALGRSSGTCKRMAVDL